MQDRSQQAALEFLKSVLAHEKGVGVLHGQPTSGKSLVVSGLVEQIREDTTLADIDGAALKAPAFLSMILEQFGYKVDLQSTDELLNMLRVVVVQQTRARQAPVLVVRNINHMYPSSLCALCKLAAQRAGDKFALRLILVGDRYFRRIIDSPSMRPIAQRLVGSYELKPQQELPRFIVTHDRETLMQFTMVDSRALVGRSEFCDITIDRYCISRQHAMFIKDDNSVIVIDLRSKNGTSVNGQRVASKVLRDNDIIEIGDHRIKVAIPAAFAGSPVDAPGGVDTAKMKTLEDARWEKGREGLDLPGTNERSG